MEFARESPNVTGFTLVSYAVVLLAESAPISAPNRSYFQTVSLCFSAFPLPSQIQSLRWDYSNRFLLLQTRFRPTPFSGISSERLLFPSTILPNHTFSGSSTLSRPVRCLWFIYRFFWQLGIVWAPNFIFSAQSTNFYRRPFLWPDPGRNFTVLSPNLYFGRLPAPERDRCPCARGQTWMFLGSGFTVFICSRRSACRVGIVCRGLLCGWMRGRNCRWEYFRWVFWVSLVVNKYNEEYRASFDVNYQLRQCTRFTPFTIP